MSRIGKKPIVVPKGVTVKIAPDALDIQGPKGKLTQRIPPGVLFELAEGQLRARTVREDPELGKFHGLARSLVANGVLGVTEGFKRELDIVGIGYRAELRGKQIVFALGYSHPVVFDVPPGIDIAIEKQTHISRQHSPSAQARSLQAEGRALHRRSAEEKSRQDRSVGSRTGS